MITVTLPAIMAAHLKVSDMIETFKKQAVRTLAIPAAAIELSEGEFYVGIILAKDAAPAYHLILLPGAATDVTWAEAKQFAANAGGELPTRREQALLFANQKEQFEERYYWSSEQHAADADCAWFQDFSYGYQDDDSKSASLRARAVRRLTIS